MAKFDRKTGQPIVDNPVEAVEEPKVVPHEEAQEFIKEHPEATVIDVPKPNVQNATFTLEDVMKLMAGVVQELKKPTEIETFRYEQEKKKVEEERWRQMKAAQQAAEEAKREEAARRGAQDLCTHKREDNTTALAGQVNSDGYVRFMCTRCFKIMPKVKAPDEWKINGVQTQAAADVSGAMRFITKEHVLAWHRGTVPDCKDACCAKKPEPVAV